MPELAGQVGLRWLQTSSPTEFQPSCIQSGLREVVEQKTYTGRWSNLWALGEDINIPELAKNAAKV